MHQNLYELSCLITSQLVLNDKNSTSIYIYPSTKVFSNKYISIHL